MSDTNDNVRRVIVRLAPTARRVTAVVRNAPNPFQLAKARGFAGTEEQWLASLQGVQGLSAYEVAVAEGYVGTVEQWLASLRGAPFTYADFAPEQLAALKGAKGDEGLSAYAVAVAAGFVGTVEQWLASLVGEQGDPFVYSDFTPEQLAALKGDPFTYADFTPEQLAALKGDPFVYSDFTPEQLAALKGAKGDDGLSAYEVAVAAGFVGTVEQWLASLEGADGAAGAGYGGVANVAYTPAEMLAQTTSFPIGGGYAYAVGARVRAVCVDDVGVWMEGLVTSYNEYGQGYLTVLVDRVSVTSEPCEDWGLTLQGDQGAQGEAGEPGAYVVSATAPLNPTDGMTWFDSTTGATYVYYSNGGNPCWVEEGGQGEVDGASMVSADIADASTGGNGAADSGKLAKFGADGSLIVSGAGVTFNDTLWDDLRFPAQAINSAGSAAPPSVSNTNGMLLFSGLSDNVIAGAGQLPHAYKHGSNLHFHIHLRFPTSAASNTRWKLEYDFANVNGSFVHASGTYTDGGTITVANPQNVSKHVLQEFNEIVCPDLKGSAIVLWKLSRLASSDGADTHTSDVELLELDVHYEIDKLGSPNEIPTGIT